VPFRLPDSVHPLNPATPLGSTMGFSQIDPLTGAALEPLRTNEMANFGWEYVWHCHILSHEENDMMRPIIAVVIDAPSGLSAAGAASGIQLTWTDNSHNETGFTVERATDPAFTLNVVTFSTAPSSPAGAYGGSISVADLTAAAGTQYYYRVQAFDTYGPATQSVNYGSAWSNTAPINVSAIAVVEVNPATLSFGNQLLGTTSPAQTVTVTNTGAAPLTINSISTGGNNPGQFAQTNNCPIGEATPLAPFASCTVNVTFKPTWTGAMSATLRVNVAAPAASRKVSLSGTGALPITSVLPASLSFGNQLRNTTSAAQTVTVTNTGAAPLTINFISIGGTNSLQFAQTNNCPTGAATPLAPGASCTVNVTFKPTWIGALSATLRVSVAAPAVSRAVSLSGTGI
jgi:hypothetical protein